MLVTMSNPLHLAVIGNPGSRRRRRASTRRRSTKKGKKMAFTVKQARGLAKAFRAQGRRVPAKIRNKIKRSRRNPGTAVGARKARRKKRRKTLKRRRATAKRYRKQARGYRVVVRRKAGRRKSNKRFSRKTGIRSGRKGTISFRGGRGRGKLVATNPRRRRRRRSRRRNPALSVKSWKSGLVQSPQRAMSLFKGKKVVSNVLWATGGAVGGLAVGGLVRGTILGAVGQVAPGIASNRLVQGVLGAAITYTGGYAVGSLLIKGERQRGAFITGAAAAAIVNAIMPGAVNRMLTSIPVIGPRLTALPGMNGMGAYVMSPGYQGVGAYVSSPGYQGVGYSPDDVLAGMGMNYNDDALAGELGAYVSSPSYQGVGMYAQSHLD